jgi:single-strand DNA-binding protein
MSYEITGIIHEIYPTTEVSSKFRKREFVIEKKEQNNSFEFIDYVKFQLTQDKCNLLDNVSRGEEVKISFNLRGRKWEKDGTISYFTNLEAWKVEKPGSAEKKAVSGTPPTLDDVPFPDSDFPAKEDPLNDLPF